MVWTKRCRSQWGGSGWRTPTPPALQKQQFEQMEHLLGVWGLGVGVFFGCWSAAGQPSGASWAWISCLGKGARKKGERIWVRNLSHASDPGWELFPFIPCLETHPRGRHWIALGAGRWGHGGAEVTSGESEAPWSQPGSSAIPEPQTGLG